MKICISTWYESYNYGTGLQAIALFEFLKKQGYDCYFLKDDINKKNKKQKIIEKIKKVINKDLFFKLLYHNRFVIQKQRQLEYMTDVNKVFYLKSFEDIKKINEFFDIFIIGGDQVLNPYHLEDKHLLTYINDNKYIFSYGSSVGVKEIPNSLKSLYMKYLTRLKYISVREKISVDALSFLNKKIYEVVDPTMLFDKKQWIEFSENSIIDLSIANKNYILCYFIGNRKSYYEYVKKIKKNTGYDIIIIPINIFSCKNSYFKHFNTSPKEFIWLINHAKIICTDSFHATIFSIIFNKEFYTLKRFNEQSKKSQNGRILNLLEKYGLSERLVSDESFFHRIENNDFCKINKLIELERNNSIEWLKNVLKETNQ